MKKAATILVLATGIYITSCSNGQTATKSSEMEAKDSLATNFTSQKVDITVDEALALSKEGAVMIDVRESEELAELAYDVSNIKHIPLGTLEASLFDVPKDQQVIVVCRSGGRSKRAQALLQSKGFDNVANMLGGMNAWSEKNLPTLANGEKKACCEDPNSGDCNPDGTCKTNSEKKDCCKKK